ncbi:hypothetical protein [Burkholderia cenocepacia]|uniref:hypothetical protein n=1 Tax=Burkholderia cenocepacia TaxID=95486 RepID=UPI00076BF555|nr:hypothetical protein [Burkholderia cenocepacia]KWU19176.1 hypothetical protein AS149_13085 [Burkholderia cenocepacia]
MDAKELRELARTAMRQAKCEGQTQPGIHHPVIRDLAEKVTSGNKELRLRTVDTLSLVLRRLRLGFIIVKRPAAGSKAGTKRKSAKTRRS